MDEDIGTFIYLAISAFLFICNGGQIYMIIATVLFLAWLGKRPYHKTEGLPKFASIALVITTIAWFIRLFGIIFD